MSGVERMWLVTALISGGALLPALVARARQPSSILLLLSTGGLISLYFGELIPEVLGEGGWASVLIILGIWAFFSRVPGLHHHGSGEEHDGHDHEDSYPTLLVLSMSAHAIASGALLYTASGLSGHAGDAAFGALLAHKGYESISVSTLLREKISTNRSYGIKLAIYILAFPLGFCAAGLAGRIAGSDFESEHVEKVATILGSIAIGTLMSCMLHDFLMPSWQRIRERRREAVWLLLGAGLSLWMSLSSHH